MSKTEKQLERLLSLPKDFTWEELVSLLRHFNFEMQNADGSKRKFVHKSKRTSFSIHKPHPKNIMKRYAIELAIEALKSAGEL